MQLAMDLNADPEDQMMIERSVSQTMQIDSRRARFPCCIVWTPLPVISWLVPFIGHIGICREDGVILDFAGPNFVCVDNFAFGAATRYIQISKEKVHLPNFIFEKVIVATSLPTAGSWQLGCSLILFYQMENLLVGLHAVGEPLMSFYYVDKEVKSYDVFCLFNEMFAWSLCTSIQFVC